MIIDAHNHVDYYGMSFDKFLQNKDGFGINLTVITPWECPRHEYFQGSKHALSPFSDYPVPFERCVQYYEKAPDRFLLGYAPDPRLPDSIGRLKSALSLYDSICMYGELKLRMMYDNVDAINMFRFCGEVGLPVLFHLEYGIDDPTNQNPWPSYWYGGDIDTIERMLIKCPETNFLAHSGGFWAHISNDDLFDKAFYPKGPIVPGGRIEKMLEKYPNLYCDISMGSGYNALTRDLDFTRKFLITWQDRIVYGRDYYDNVHQELLKGETLSLPADVQEKIFYKNALKVLRNVKLPLGK